jgi:Zn-finger nucleic acid-binding protein
VREQYRESALACPICPGWLEPHATSASVVDVCANCRSVWIDWFDGEIASVAGEVRPRGNVLLPAPADAEKRGCPRCRRALIAEPFRDHGPEVLRCPECAGVLVPASVLKLVVAMGPPVEQPPTEPSVLARLIEALRRIVAEDR